MPPAVHHHPSGERGHSPGIASLHRLIEEYGEAIEADLLRQGIDIRCLGGVLSYRRLRVILANSPADSAYSRAIAGSDWTQDTYLLALIADELAVANWQRTGGKVAYPEPVPRPEVEVAEPEHRTVISIEEAEAWAARRREA